MAFIRFGLMVSWFGKLYRKHFESCIPCRGANFAVYFYENLPKKLPYEKIQQIFYKKLATLLGNFYG